MADFMARRRPDQSLRQFLIEAGINPGTIWWLQQRPDLRLSVVRKLAQGLGVRPGTLADAILDRTPEAA